MISPLAVFAKETFDASAFGVFWAEANPNLGQVLSSKGLDSQARLDGVSPCGVF